MSEAAMTQSLAAADAAARGQEQRIVGVVWQQRWGAKRSSGAFFQEW